MSEPIFAGIEAGGTTFAVAIAKGKATNIIDKTVIDTTTPEETLKKVYEWLESRKINFNSIGIASFGPIDLNVNSPTYGYITTTPKPGWANTNIRGYFQKLQIPIGFDTDVNAAAIAEMAHGGYTDVTTCCYVTIGTGIGVGIVVNGQPLHGLMHPEGGHIYVPPCPGDSFEGNCPYHKNCLEGFLATGSLSARTRLDRRNLASLPDDHEIWKFAAFYLAQLCVTLTLTLSPHIIVLGGGVMNRKCLYDMTRKKFIELLNGYVKAGPLPNGDISKYIVPAMDHSGLIGSLELAWLAFNKTSGKN